LLAPAIGYGLATCQCSACYRCWRKKHWSVHHL